jgi:formyltetrahydrofolate deformylase
MQETDEVPPLRRLIVSCPDRPGIVAAVSTFLADCGANMVHADQHTTHDGNRFFMRIELEGGEGFEAFTGIAQDLQMTYRFVEASVPKRLAIFVSKEDHCLQELLWHIRAGDIPAEIAVVIGNHAEVADVVVPFGVPFHHVPVTAHTKLQAEAEQLRLCEGVDTVVLARYMQIVSPRFLEVWRDRVINIHHSFLPAFVGARPYHQAFERGVKLIGATAHYVTEELDAGPIIEQDVTRVDHRADAAELKRLGRQVERGVLARAVKWHVEDRVIVYGNRTVVFN